MSQLIANHLHNVQQQQQHTQQAHHKQHQSSHQVAQQVQQLQQSVHKKTSTSSSQHLANIMAVKQQMMQQARNVNANNQLKSQQAKTGPVEHTQLHPST